MHQLKKHTAHSAQCTVHLKSAAYCRSDQYYKINGGNNVNKSVNFIFSHKKLPYVREQQKIYQKNNEISSLLK